MSDVVKAIEALVALCERTVVAEMEQQAQMMGGTAFGAGQFYRGQPQ